MKSASYTLIALLFMAITSCTGQNNSDNYYGEEDQYAQPNSNSSDYQNEGQNQGQWQQGQGQGQPNVYNTNNNGGSQQSFSQNQGGGNVVMHPIMDPKTNQPISQIPLPANWKILTNVQPNSPGITGPDGIEVYFYSYQSFVFSNDQFMQQSYQAAGQQMRRPAGIENLLNQDLAKMAQGIGLKFIKNYSLPQVAQADKSYNDKLYQVGQPQNTFQAAGSDWEDGKGNKVAMILHYNESVAYGSVYWGYYVQVLGSKAAAFEDAKKTYINGLVNTQYNQQAIASYNQQEAAKANQSMAASNQRLQNNQANFDAQQRAHQSASDAWNKSSMDAYNSRSASQDRMQSQTINSINETQNVTDPSNGQQYQVEGYSNQYWMNGQGEYIPSDNSLYNPNQDQNYNNQTWEEAPVSPY